MKIEKVTIENFRGYSKETTINLGQLNLFIGKNDVGKSTILEALDIFLNDGKGTIKIDNGDKNIHYPNDDISITVSFSDCPEEVIIDSTNKTSLEAEHLLNSKKLLEIKKVFKGATLKVSTFIFANHPTCKLGKDLLLKKISDLKNVVNENNWECSDKTRSAVLRKTIWGNCGDLELKEIYIATDKEDAKKFWEKIEQLLPAYALFQSDRENNDSDDTVQSPMKLAVQEVLQNEDLQNTLNKIAETVKGQVEKIVDETLEKLKEMNPKIGENLKPLMPETSKLKWADVFKNISIHSEDGISLNKRGSGVKRLVLLSFFRAAAERVKNSNKKSNLIYAMEEPETSQHPEHQEVLIEAFETLSKDCQILLTTHSPVIVQLLAKRSYNFEEPEKNYNINLIIVKKENKDLSVTTGEQLSQSQLALKHISANEISFLAFEGYVNEEFHTELYSFIENNYDIIFKEKINPPYKPENANESLKKYYNDHPKVCKYEYITLHKYIRNQIHHPPKDDTNPKYTPEELRKSIEEMRKWLLTSD